MNHSKIDAALAHLQQSFIDLAISRERLAHGLEHAISTMLVQLDELDRIHRMRAVDTQMISPAGCASSYPLIVYSHRLRRPMNSA
jgi:hypothetical protein